MAWQNDQASENMREGGKQCQDTNYETCPGRVVCGLWVGRVAFFLTPGPPNLRAIGAMARRRQSKRCEGRVRGRGYSRRGHGPGEKARAHLSRWCGSAPQAAGEGARRARAPGGAQPGERRKKRTEACLGSSCSARSRAGRGGTRRPGCVSCESGRRAGQVSARRTRGGPHRVRGPRRRRAVPRMHRPEPGGRSCYDVRTRGPQAGVRVGRSRLVRRGFPRRESLISGGDGCETSVNAHNTVYRVLITVKLYYVVVVFFVYHLSLFPGGGALKFIGRPWSSVARHCTRRHLLTSVSLSFPQCLVLCV